MQNQRLAQARCGDHSARKTIRLLAWSLIATNSVICLWARRILLHSEVMYPLNCVNASIEGYTYGLRELRTLRQSEMRSRMRN